MSKKNKLILLLFTTCSCSTMRTPSINMLEQRADYNGERDKAAILKEANSLFAPNKTKPQAVDIYVHPHETIHGDYFLGGFVRSIVQGSQWEFSKTTATPLVAQVKKGPSKKGKE